MFKSPNIVKSMASEAINSMPFNVSSMINRFTCLCGISKKTHGSKQMYFIIEEWLVFDRLSNFIVNLYNLKLLSFKIVDNNVVKLSYWSAAYWIRCGINRRNLTYVKISRSKFVLVSWLHKKLQRAHQLIHGALSSEVSAILENDWFDPGNRFRTNLIVFFYFTYAHCYKMVVLKGDNATKISLYRYLAVIK